MTSADLLYLGKPMTDRDTDGLSATQIGVRLSAERAQRVVLEPGDGTRYDLWLCFEAQDQLVVVRLVGGHITGAANLPPWFSDFDIAPLINGNEWTRTFLRWYLQRIWGALGVEKATRA